MAIEETRVLAAEDEACEILMSMPDRRVNGGGNNQKREEKGLFLNQQRALGGRMVEAIRDIDILS
jgi:hypothetical protein